MSTTRSHVSMQNKYDRVVLLVDMDCFFCQVEEKQQPEYRNRPLAVVQYNKWRGGGIIAVNYAARAKGVTRHMRGDEAKELCPEIVLCEVPNIREKADTGKYRDAGKEVANVLQRFTQLLERASVDEAYLDITDTVNLRMKQLQSGAFALKPQELVNTFAVGYTNIGDYVNKITNRFANPYIDDERFQLAYDQNDLPAVRQSDIRLLIGASIAGEVRAAVKKDTGYDCSAGIAHNKILAKLAAGLNKPNKQTILPLAEIPGLFDSLPVGKIKGLGGKFGEVLCETLGITFLGQLVKYTEAELQRKFDEKNGSWLFYICRGIDLEAVTPRFYSKSIGCCKKFPGRNNITGLKSLQHWLGELSSEINDRLDKDFMENNRKAKQMVVQFVQDINGEEVASSRSTSINNYDQETLAKLALDLIKANTKTFLKPGSDAALNNSVKFLGMSVGKFETISKSQNSLQNMFANQAAKNRRVSGEEAVQQPKVQVEVKLKPTEDSKMKSFFANYLQGGKKEEKKPADPAPVEDTPKVSAGASPKKSFFEEYKEKLKAVSTTEGAAEGSSSTQTSTPPELKGSFFANYLKQQNAAKEQHIEAAAEGQGDKEQTKTQEVEEAADNSSDLQGLAEELDAIEAGHSQDFDEDTIEDETLTSKANTSVPPEKPTSTYQPLTEEELKPSTSKRKFDQLNSSSTSSYKESYAEYAVPEIRPDLLPMVKCDQCGAKIPDDVKALQTHRDHHFAQELSRQLRTEQREKRQLIPMKTSPKPTPPKKQKKSVGSASGGTSSSSTAPANSIAKFFSAKPPVEPPSSNIPTQQCSECKAYIKIECMTEHLDYHVAKSLQRELNHQDLRTRAAALGKQSSSPGQAKKQQKQKQLNATIANTSGRGGSKPITQFFTQTN
ncbi:DNA polymerase eta [Drosophila guanche]|uniref:DNA polymerase eta n=1 Tax=Drosophila guanche TaxID=7266 RepID=A0A3B0J3W2_DROGU|nr:DNA polymerase eta [Drosophila guanche]SPP76404.1 blast:DNA polymerase eta [Drosophila guanche]